MNLEISFRHMEHTESIDERIREKVEKFAKKHFSNNATLKWTAWVESQDHFASVHAVDKGHEYFAKANTESMYKTIDQTIHKLEAQVEHHNFENRRTS